MNMQLAKGLAQRDSPREVKSIMRLWPISPPTTVSQIIILQL